MRPLKRLDHQTCVEIIPTCPFHFDSTVFKPAHFPSSDTQWESGRRWQTMLWRGKPLGLILENRGSTERPRIRLHIYSAAELGSESVDSLRQEIEYRFNLQLDLEDFYQAFQNDELLRLVLQRFRGLRPMHPGGLYEYLIIAIVLQNATVRRSVNMLQTLFEHYGSRVRFDDKTFFCFWEPQRLAQASEAELRALKVGYRAQSLIRVSEPFVDGRMDELALRGQSQSDQERTLLNLYGIGPASAGYILFDVFHHWDFLKHISPWEQKIYTKLFFNKDYHRELVAERTMLKYFDRRFGRYKGLAVHYLWEDLWWKRRNENIPWLEELIRL